MTPKTVRFMLAGAGLLAAAGAAQAQRIPPGHLPPPGQCRLWLPDRPPGHQPPPTSCRRAERQADRFGGQVIYGGSGGPFEEWNRHDERRFLRWALRHYDLNGDGRLSRGEYRRARAAYDR